jgi:hypothetical protein
MNHSHLKDTDRAMTPDMVEALLRSIVTTKFNGLFTVERWSDPQGELAAWTVSFSEEEGFQVWLNDGHHIEMPHSMTWAAGFHWVQDVMIILLRTELGGNVYDDGVGEVLFLDDLAEDIYPFRKWWKRVHDFFPEDIQERQWKETVLGGPENIMALLRLGDEEPF